jgi:hypothetical protein
VTFHYGLVDSDEAREIYAKLLADWVAKFRKSWEKHHAGLAPTEENIGRAYKGWWMTVGPTSFKTPADANRFKADLRAAVVAELASITERREGESVSVTVKVKGMDTGILGKLGGDG